jgi:uncharacterized protein (DUF1499 family)
VFNFAGSRPNNLGVKEGKLASCPNSPNCVCSQSETPYAKIAPFTGATISQIKQIVAGMEKTKIVRETEDYLYAEFTTPLMGFVDDVEFWHDRANNLVHVRSASRLGKSDLGVNRQRVETIRERLLG